MAAPLPGVVVRKSSRDLIVDTARGALRCVLRGRFRVGSDGRAPAVVGDNVLVLPCGEAEGTLERILPRRSEFTRVTAGGRDVLLAANIERLLIVIAARDPPPRWALVDRMLVSAEREGLEAGICLNKWDQVEGDAATAAELSDALALYARLGYPAFRSSAARREGIEAVAAWLQARITVVSGHSGVGKSTILNAIDPGLDLRTGEVSASGRGRQTTTAVSLHPLPGGGYVADTPGFREFALAGLTPAELGRHYPELRELSSSCRYPDCLHAGDPGCAVAQGLERGAMSNFRYQNYLQILASMRGGREESAPVSTRPERPGDIQ